MREPEKSNLRCLNQPFEVPSLCNFNTDGWRIPASVQLRPIADNPEEVSTPNNVDQTRYETPEPWDEDRTEADAAELAIDTFSTAAQGGAQNEPKTFQEALTRPDADLWTQAALEELEAHQRNGTWSRTQLPKGASAIGCRWVLKVKRNTDGSIERYKARLVAKSTYSTTCRAPRTCN